MIGIIEHVKHVCLGYSFTVVEIQSAKHLVTPVPLELLARAGPDVNAQHVIVEIQLAVLVQINRLKDAFSNIVTRQRSDVLEP